MTKISNADRADSMEETVGKDYIKNFSKRMLKTQLFMGTFHEKRFVNPLNSYRDVVKIDPEEKEFIENVVAVKRKIKQELVKYSSKNEHLWVGITDPHTVGAPVGYNLWVVLPVAVFGKYWFKVKTVEFLENEVRAKLDIVRPLTIEKSLSDVSLVEDSRSFDLKTTVQDISENFKTKLTSFVKNHVTLKNTKESVIFISLLIGTIIAGGVNIIKYLMEYMLKLIKELSGFVKVCTPIIITSLNLIGKAIYGLYALIIALYLGKPSRPRAYPNNYCSVDPNRMIEFGDPRQKYSKYFSQKALPYKSSVIITPIDD